MRTALDCIPCFARQALVAARFVSRDPAVHARVLRDVLRTAADMDLEDCPPRVGQRIHRRLREITGIADPYRDVKDRFNRMALEMLPELETAVTASDDPFRHAVRLAIAGNVIDLGVDGTLTEARARATIGATLDEPFDGDVDALREAVGAAERILYVADNAGEIVFDRLLLEQLPPERVALAVRGRPVLNDATREDAAVAGLDKLVEIIDTGSDAPGAMLADCSEPFRERFAASDLVIAKGQGNFEGLSDEPAEVFFLFKAKCSVVAGRVGLPLGTHVVRRSAAQSGPDDDTRLCIPCARRAGRPPQRTPRSEQV